MKARDIIPGWPRGHSTSRPIRVPAAFFGAWLKAKMVSRAHPIFGPSDTAFMQFTIDAVQVHLEGKRESAYRAAQNEMLDKYHMEALG